MRSTKTLVERLYSRRILAQQITQIGGRLMGGGNSEQHLDYSWFLRIQSCQICCVMKIRIHCVATTTRHTFEFSCSKPMPTARNRSMIWAFVVE